MGEHMGTKQPKLLKKVDCRITRIQIDKWKFVWTARSDPCQKIGTPLKNEGLPKNPGRPIDFTIIKNKRRNFTIFGLLNIL